MKHNFIKILVFTFLFFLTPNTALAETLPPKMFSAQIKSNTFVAAGEAIDFDASDSRVLDFSEGVPRYIWNFGDGGIKWGKEVFYKYKSPGKYQVELKIKQGNQTDSTQKSIIVYQKSGLLISNSSEKAASLVDQAGRNGVRLETIIFEKNAKGISGEVDFAKNLAEKVEFLKESDYVIFQTNSGAAFQSFGQWWQSRPEESRFSLAEKTWLQLSEGSFEKTTKLIESAFSILSPRYIVISRISALNTLFEKSTKDFPAELESRGISFEIIDGNSKTFPLFLFSKITNYLITKGIAQSVLYILLSVPFIVFVIAFFRQFIGISTFGVFAPLMLALSFMLLGLNFGFLVFAIVLLVSYLIRLLFDRLELLYIPKVSLLFSALAISFFFVLGVAIYLDISLDLALAVFPMMVMSTISEKFISAQSEGGLKNALISAGETVLVSLIAFALVRWTWFESSVLSFPELILLPVLGNFWLGKFTGLRMSEYLKFRTLLRGVEEQEE